MLRTIDLLSGDEIQDSDWQAPPAPAPIESDYTAAIVALLDVKARERRYDGAVSLSTYVGSTNAQWAVEALAFVAWRDAVWTYAYSELEKVEGGQRPQPTVAEFIADLPALDWP
ncbi:hypothetical protein [Aminobacter carboxidus]|uniref:hypothetical protein n=1 Tax=Aminobacter carboxidus TaxID=376165 RepID=UPI0031B56F6B